MFSLVFTFKKFSDELTRIIAEFKSKKIKFVEIRIYAWLIFLLLEDDVFVDDGPCFDNRLALSGVSDGDRTFNFDIFFN